MEEFNLIFFGGLVLGAGAACGWHTATLVFMVMHHKQERKMRTIALDAVKNSDRALDAAKKANELILQNNVVLIEVMGKQYIAAKRCKTPNVKDVGNA